MARNITEEYIDALQSLSEREFSNEIRMLAKRCLLDYLGVTIAGARMLGEKGKALLAQSHTPNPRGVSLIGFGRKVDLAEAVFINGLSAHVAELDDGARYGALHPGSPIFSALLPVAESENVSGRDLIRGIVVGYEAAVRIASAIQPSHYGRGYHPTGTCGAIGSAIGLSAMLKLSRDQLRDALSAAVVTASGMLKVIEDGSELKPYNVARAAQTGHFSVRMARAGFKGLDDALSGATGFLSMMADSYDESCLVQSSNSKLGIEKVYFKPYASCRHTHAPIEAALNIQRSHRFALDDVEAIRITTYRGVIGKHDHTDIRGGTSAKMSIPFSVAVALVTGKAGLDQFTDLQAEDSRVLALTRKIRVQGDDAISALVPDKRIAIVDIETKTGNVFSERVELPKGEPENPLSDNEMEEKFVGLAHFGGKSNEDCESVIRSVWEVETLLPNLFQLM